MCHAVGVLPLAFRSERTLRKCLADWQTVGPRDLDLAKSHVRGQYHVARVGAKSRVQQRLRKREGRLKFASRTREIADRQ